MQGGIWKQVFPYCDSAPIISEPTFPLNFLLLLALLAEALLVSLCLAGPIQLQLAFDLPGVNP